MDLFDMSRRAELPNIVFLFFWTVQFCQTQKLSALASMTPIF